MALGKGTNALEVVVTTSTNKPKSSELQSAWKKRNGKRAAPLLFVVLYKGEVDKDRAAVCGPSGDSPTARLDLEHSQVERICREALEQDDRHAALRSLRDSLWEINSKSPGIPGIRNEGFLAIHELIHGARKRTDWNAAKGKAMKVLGMQGEDRIRALGFDSKKHDQVTRILSANNQKIGVALLLNRHESPEINDDRFSGISPIAYAFSVADNENLPYVIIDHGPQIRVYPTKVGVGVGRRGRTETYVQCHTGLLSEDDAGLLWLLCSGDALVRDGTLEELLDSSGRFAADLAEKLRERIYQSVIPALAQGLVDARGLKKPKAKDLVETYQMALTLLFRFLFIAYAEDKDLLPYRWNDLYQRRSLKTKAQELLELSQKKLSFDTGDSLWAEVSNLFDAVDQGSREWGVPAYNGGLFDSNKEASPIGSLIKGITLPNTVLGPALTDLLLAEDLGPVDFRSLGVREFGTIYEGLLESELSVADTDLTIDKKGVYKPAKDNDQVFVKKGNAYLHNASGARKSTGSYFTKAFAVEHLLERSLKPALDCHFEKLDKLDPNDASEKFFDFRVADIAMGSGHFLVSAIDHIEQAFTVYLSNPKRRLPGVINELAALRKAAKDALGDLAEQIEIEDAQLLRRMIARRCIYGVDLNPMSVQLAKVGIWIHTFVPGLPLSFLDHNLVCGNSLVGIGQLDELKETLEEAERPLLPIDVDHFIGDSAEPLTELAKIADASIADIKRAQKVQAKAYKMVEPARALFDIATAYRLHKEYLPSDIDDIDANKWETIKDSIVDSPEHVKSKQLLKSLNVLHFPIAFPEVFLREKKGFDVLIGNPPWEEATVEKDAFWARHSPGLRGLPQRDQEALKMQLREQRPDLYEVYQSDVERAKEMRRALVTGPYPGMGTGDPDAYKAFCWRFWDLAAKDVGKIGVVLPRQALSAKGSTEYREKIFSAAGKIDITALVNSKHWVFEDVAAKYTIGLVSVDRKSSGRVSVCLKGPYSSYERFQAGIKTEPVVFNGDDIKKWNDAASLPLLPSDKSASVFVQLRNSPRLDFDDGKSWRVRPHAELHATNDKKLMDLKSEKCPNGYWPVYKGESFDIWSPDTGKYYAWADPEVMLPALQERRRRSGRNKRSAFSEFWPNWLKDKETLPCNGTRIAFRDIARATDTRTMIPALIPENIFCANKAPTLLWVRGGVDDQAYLLGALSSIPLDWYARRFVEIGMSYFVLNPLPVPRPDADNRLRLRVIALAGRLASPDNRFKKWADAVGVECGPLSDDEKKSLMYELDAVVAHLYGLKPKHLTHIFETFHEGWDYQERLKETLEYYRSWKGRL